MRTTKKLYPSWPATGIRHLARVATIVTLVSGLLAGGPATADDMVRYSVPNSDTGISGAGLIYHGYAAPRSRFNFQTNSVFWDATVNGSGAVVMIAKNGDNQIDPATDEEQKDSDTHELVVGLSDDGGENFAFHRVLKWKKDGLRMVRVGMVPDEGRPEVWVGIAQIWGNIENSVAEEFKGSTLLEIDWGQQKVRLLDQDEDGWDEYDFGKENPPQPGYFSDDRELLFTHLARVKVNNQWRYEAWASVPVTRDEDNLPDPCQDEGIYGQNTAGGWNSKGRRIVYYRFYPGAGPGGGVDLMSGKTIASDVRSLPTSYQRSDQQVIRGQFDDDGVLTDFLYVGTQDQIVCRQLVTSNSGGASVRYIELEYDPVTDNYTEVEHAYLLDITNANNPNWTCEDPRVKCTSSNLNHYANINAVPYQDPDADRIQLYVGAWGTKAPSLPAIGQAGHVTVGESPATVTLDIKLEDPVVFVQPPSYDQATPVIARVSDVGDNGTATTFKVRLQTDSGTVAAHAPEKLSYIVLEAGTYRLADKRVMEVAKVQTSETSPNGTKTWTSKLDLEDSHDFYTGAVVFTQLQTMNDSYYAKTRHYGPPTVESSSQSNAFGESTPVRLAKVSFGIERDQASQSAGFTHGTEDVGVLLIGEKWIGRSSSVFGLGPWGAKGFDVGRVSGVAGIVNAGWKSITFEQPKGTGALNNPVLLAWTETNRGTDPTNVRYDKLSLTPTGVDLAVDEDQSQDAERNHTGETVVYWVLGKGAKLIRAQPVDPEYDTLY